MPAEPPAVLRALEGLRQFSGRTLAVVGPPESGKSAVLERIGEHVHRLEARVVRLRGAYADRLVPFAGLAGIHRATVDAEGLAEVAVVSAVPYAPMAPVAVNPEELPRSHRRRAERAGPSFLGEPSRPRGADAIDLPSYWEELLAEFQGPDAHPVVFLVDNAAYLDPESRAFLLGLGALGRLRPLLLVLALDSSVAETSLWLDALRARGGTDWVHQPESAPDAREVQRYRELLGGLPERTVRLVGYLALLGGEAPDHVLVRIARLGHAALSDALRPATERGLVRLRDGRYAIPDRAAPPIIAELAHEGVRAEMHREIAEALEALSPEPTLARRIEVARHFLASRPGATAMSHLVQAAEVCLEQLEFDTAAELLQEAFGCLVLLPPADRRTLEPEVRLFLARALFYGGRPAEAEAQLREGVERALEAGTPPPELEVALEPILLAVRAVGPRGSLGTTLTELAERCVRAGRAEAQILLDTLATELFAERRQFDRAEEAALRVARAARQRSERHLQGLGLLAMGLARTAPDADEAFPAERFLHSAHHLLTHARRWEFDYLVAELEVRLVESKGELDQARHLRETSLTVLASEKFPSIELAHHLGLAALDLDAANTAAAGASLERAGRLLEKMHLLPPSPHLLAYWLLEGRRQAYLGAFDRAREHWSALVELPADASLPRFQAEALVRLGLLSTALGRPEEAAALGVVPPTAPGLDALPSAWRAWLSAPGDLTGFAGHGGGPLPPRREDAN